MSGPIDRNAILPKTKVSAQVCPLVCTRVMVRTK